MKTIFKKITAVITAAVMLATSFVFDIPEKLVVEATAGTAVVCSECDHTDHTGWTPLTSTGGNLYGGKYYLESNKEISTKIKIPANNTVYLCLNGQEIKNIGTSNIIHIYGNANFHLYDCSSDGTGKLKGGDSQTSCGVYVADDGTFTMHGGTITGCHADTSGAGVYVDSSGTFIMTGGKISNNTAGSDGGGVSASGTFTMTGGTISDNTASGGGGGVYVSGTFKIDGKVNITNNTSGRNNTSGNVYLANGKTITIGSNFDDVNSQVGVTYGTSDPTCYRPATIATVATNKSLSTSLSSDKTGFRIEHNTGENDVKLFKDHQWESSGTITAEPTCGEAGVKTYECIKKSSGCTATKTESIPASGSHSYTYSSSNNGAAITQTCSNCSTHSATATLTLDSSVSLVYKGSAITPVTISYSGDAWEGTEPTVNYSPNNTNAGNVTASITVEEVTASVGFEITKAAPTVTAPTPNNNLAYTGSAQNLISAGTVTGGQWKYKLGNASYSTDIPSAADAGTYTVYYKVEGDDNHTDIAEQSFTVEIAKANPNPAPTVSIDGWTYGETAKEPSVTGNIGGGNVTYQYKVKDADDNTYVNNKPTKAGTYTVKATIAETDNYKSATATKDFTIAQKSLNGGTITLAKNSYPYTGNSIEPTMTVKDADDNVLTKGTDYTVAYTHSNGGTDHTNPGKVTVTVTGTGNYKDSLTTTFTIDYQTLPTGKSLTDYVEITPKPKDGWYGSDITIKPKDGSGCSVGETPDNIGSSAVTITTETGTDGSKKTIYVKDSSNNIYQTEFPYKLDKSAPAVNLSNMTVENGSKVFGNLITGTTNTIIKIPTSDITDDKSGVATVTYTATTDGGVEKTGTINAEGGYYKIDLSKIATDGEFVGTIKLTVTDKVGNTKEVSLPTSDGKVIVEQHKPEITFTLPNSPQPNGEDWYNQQVSITVTVTDNKNGITSGGIAEIKWKDGVDGTVNTISDLPGNAAVYSNTFTINTTDGEHTYYVKVVDNAGNVSAGTDGWQSITVKVDTVAPSFTNVPAAESPTKDGAVIKFTPSENVKAYWIVSDTAPQNAQAVKNQFVGEPENVAKDGNGQFTLSGLTTGQKHTVYVVLEDVAGNLSAVKNVSFLTRQEAPNISLDDLNLNYKNETITLPNDKGKLEAYTDPSDTEGSKLEANPDGTIPVDPGTKVYIRHPKITTEDGLETPPSESVEIKIPNRPSDPAAKEVTVTETKVTVTAPTPGEEYVLVERGQTPNWINPAPNTTGQFEGLTPNKEYDLYVRKKATESAFASNSEKTETRTYVVIKDPTIEGDGNNKDGNTAPKPNLPNDNGSVTFTGTYSEEYTPVIKTTDGQSIIPGATGTDSEMTWDEGENEGTWKYTLDTNGAEEAKITVEFRKRAITRIDVTPDTLTIFADNTANASMNALNDYVKANSSVNAAYDNKTSGAAQAVYSTIGIFTQKGADYVYSVSASAKTDNITLTVKAVSAAVTAPDKYLQSKKAEGYTTAEVQTWLPANVTVTYTGDGYTAKTESIAVTWSTSSIGSGFGNTLGENTIAGTVDLPPWATGANSVNMVIEFVDKIVLNDDQIKVDLPNFSYGTQLPNPTGSVTVTDTNPTYTYHYSTDGGTTWVEADDLPKSDSDYIIPGEYKVKVSYTGDRYIGEKTAPFTVGKKPLTILPGTFEVLNKNYDGTTNTEIKEGGQPTLSGAVEGDKVTLGGTLSAVFTEAGPKANIPVTVTGFILEGDNAEYYELKEETLTLHATINNADGTPPGSEKEDNDRDDDYDNSHAAWGENNTYPTEAAPTSGLTTQPTPKLTTQPTPEPMQHTETQANPWENITGSAISEITEITEISAISESTDQPEQDTEPNDTGTPEITDLTQPQEVTQTVQASVDNGKITVPEGTVSTGNAAGTSKTTTTLKAGDGTVTVKVVCEEEKYTAGVKDTVAVANAVLKPEQIQLVNDGENIEIRVEVKDISEAVPEQDKGVIETGLAECRTEMPDMTLGMYVDISMFIKVGKGDWNAVTTTTDPIEVVVSVPEELQESGREFYIIRSHEGEHTLLTDMDDDPSTITVETNLFSAYAIAYEQVEVSAKCGLCHICPTFLGICCFIWLAIALAVLVIIWIIVLRKRKAKNEAVK